LELAVTECLPVSQARQLHALVVAVVVRLVIQLLRVEQVEAVMEHFY
jgi:hypothetical protein